MGLDGRRRLDDHTLGAEAKNLFADARALLDRIVAEKGLRASGVVGLWPASSTGDDIELYTDEARGRRLAVLHTKRLWRSGS